MLSPGSLQNILAGAAAGNPEAKLPLQREVLFPEDIPAWFEGLWQERAGKSRLSFAAKLGPQQGHVLTGPTFGGSLSPGLGNMLSHALPQSLVELPQHQTHCRLVGLVKGEGSLLVRDPHFQSTTHSMIPLPSIRLIPV